MFLEGRFQLIFFHEDYWKEEKIMTSTNDIFKIEEKKKKNSNMKSCFGFYFWTNVFSKKLMKNSMNFVAFWSWLL